MTTRTDMPLEDVLDMLLAEHGAPTRNAVAVYSTRYPEHRASILEFAGGWAEEEHLPAPAAAPSREDEVAARARALLRKGLAARPAPMTLSELATSVGRSLKDVSGACGLDTTILSKLNARRIAPASVGCVLPLRIAEYLEVARDAVVATWSAAPRPLAAAAFLDVSASVRVTQETLEEALIKAGTHPHEIAELLRGE